MGNELKNICDLLDGYADDKKFVVRHAYQREDGSWELLIIRQDKLEALTDKPAAGAGNEVAENDNF